MVKTLADFAKLLNDVKRDEFKTDKYKITEGKLLHFCNPKTVPNRFKTFYIRKKSGGLREINAPCYQLGSLLYILNIVFKAVYTPSESAMGFTENRSVVSNASMHIGHHYVFNIDLENFFPSIPQARVWARIQLPPFNLTQKVANVVAGLCCHPNTEKSANVLPQGAATSPLLTNAICDTLDRRMRGVARRFGLHYSRYADDMTFSSMHNVYQEGSDFRVEIKRIIEGQGFKMNDKKTRLLRDGERQEVTGLTVNQSVNVTRKYVHDLRWILHCWEKEGYGKTYAKFYNFYKRTKGYIKKGEPVMENVIDGKLNYMRMVKGSNNPTYRKLLRRFEKLQGVVFEDTETYKGKSYVYVYSYSVSEFKRLFNTDLILTVSVKNKLVAKCQIEERSKVLAISRKTQKFLCKDLAKKLPEDKIESKELNKCFITLCRAKGKNFWLITMDEMKRSKCQSLINVDIDVDTLLEIWKKDGIYDAADALHYAVTERMPISFWDGHDTSKKAYQNRESMPAAPDGKRPEKLANINTCSDSEHIEEKKSDPSGMKSSLNEEGMKDMLSKEVSELIYYFTHNKNLTRLQQVSRNRLLARDCMASGVREESDSESKASSGKESLEIGTDQTQKDKTDGIRYVSPSHLHSFLYRFNQDPILKYTCHEIDTDEVIASINEICGTQQYDFQKHATKIRERLSSLLSEFISERKFLDKKFIGMLCAYVGISQKEWSSLNIKTSWNSSDIISWSKTHMGIVLSPGRNIARKQKNNGFKLERALRSNLTGNRILTFRDLVIYFKSLFHIRRDNPLKKIIEYVDDRPNIKNKNISIFFSNFSDDIELFTDVDKLVQAYKVILRIFRDANKGGQLDIDVSFYESDGCVYFTIYDKNHIYGKSLSATIKRIGESQTNLIKNQINGLCDLYIEAEFPNKEFARIGLWTKASKPIGNGDIPNIPVERLHNATGVKYILKFN